MRNAIPTLAFVLAPLVPGAAFGDVPPHLGKGGRADYGEYLASRDHRAFAIAPGGAWGWDSGAPTPDEAAEVALSACAEGSAFKCVVYSIDGKPVFDAKAWPRLWGPYADATTARRAAMGTKRGQRFPDLAFAGPDGLQMAVSRLRGKAVVLHFWGSWCGPCRREMPDLQKFYEGLKLRRDVAFVLLQVREDFAASQRWAASQKLALPFFDSGATAAEPHLRTADGAGIGDREVAMTFPTTYVLDRRGIVIFSHTGPVPDWSEYRDFILDAAQRSGR